MYRWSFRPVALLEVSSNCPCYKGFIGQFFLSEIKCRRTESVSTVQLVKPIEALKVVMLGYILYI